MRAASTVLITMLIAQSSAASANDGCASYDNISNQTKEQIGGLLGSMSQERRPELEALSDEVISWYCFHSGTVFSEYPGRLGLEMPKRLEGQFLRWMNAIALVHSGDEGESLSLGSEAANAEAKQLLEARKPAQCDAEALFWANTAIGCATEYDVRFRADVEEKLN